MTMARHGKERIVETTYRGTYSWSRSEEWVATWFYLVVGTSERHSGEVVL
jgi:hypothetical protein